MAEILNIKTRKKQIDANNEHIIITSRILERSTFKCPDSLSNATSCSSSTGNSSSNEACSPAFSRSSSFENFDHDAQPVDDAESEDEIEFSMSEFINLGKPKIIANKEGIRMNNLGCEYASKGDIINAMRHWVISWECHHYCKAAFNIGLCYAHGKSVEPNVNEAAKFFYEASKEKHPGSLYNLADLILSDILKNEECAFNMTSGVGYLKLAAELGLAEAQNRFAMWCSETEGGDAEEVFGWFQKAAQQNLPDAMHNLGVCYEFGFGTSVDMAMAAQWYEGAASLDYVDAQHYLAVFYRDGRGDLDVDLEKALDLFQKAAGQGKKESSAAAKTLRDALKTGALESTEQVKAVQNPEGQGQAIPASLICDTEGNLISLAQ